VSIASKPLQILSLITPERITMTVRGEIDLATAPQLRHAMTDHLEHGSASLHLDLSGVTFMDSSGVQAMLAVQRRARPRGSDLILFRSSPQVNRLLELMGLELRFAIEPTAATVAGA
jgi:anti-sigma B factor antagonist